MNSNDLPLTRRQVIAAGLGTGAALVLAGCGGDDDSASSPTADDTPTTEDVSTDATASTGGTGAGTTLEPTPSCDDGDEPTPEMTEGPFFTPDSPERTDLTEGVDGATLTIVGQVVGTDCSPIAGALLDFWQCDAEGVYDNEGYTLRGHQFADDDGRFELVTIHPGIYPGRTRHIHVKVQPPDGAILTTQLFFPADADANAADGIFAEACLMDVRDNGDAFDATFTFVV